MRHSLIAFDLTGLRIEISQKRRLDRDFRRQRSLTDRAAW
jgi:hypothetical protein